MAASVTAPGPVAGPAPLVAPAAKDKRATGKDKAARKPLSVAAAIAVSVMIVSGLVVLFGAYLLLGSNLQQSREQDVLFDDLKSSLGQATVPVSGVIAPGTPIALLEVPSIGLQQVVVEGSSSEETTKGPGLQLDSVLPGQTGVSVIVGRRATFGAPFADLDKLATGDKIVVTTGQGEAVYTIDVVRTTDAPATEIESVPSRLSLVTSDPVMTPTRSLVVSAQLDSKPLPASTGVTAPANNHPGEGDESHGVALLLWSQLLLLVAGLTGWAATRLPARALWIGATPVLLAILWNVFENLAVLLPNTL